MDHRARQARLQDRLRLLKLESLLVTHMPNVRYLSGFTGSSGVLAVLAGPRERMALFTDGRYTTQAREQAQGVQVRVSSRPALVAAMDWLRKAKPANVGFESQHLTVAAHARLKAEAHGARLKPAADLLERLRMIKEPAEIQLMRDGAELASRVFDAVLGELRPGAAEADVAAGLEYLCRRMGAEGMSFETLVSSGKRSALPHGVASRQPIPAKGFVILDFGVILGGYCSDMTRTVHVGRPDAAARKIYAVVREAQQRAMEKVAAGIAASDVDRAARQVIQSAGYGKFFTHSTGHGVGLEIHELPALRAAAGGKKSRPATSEILEPGMVVTIEPGIYVPGLGGVRIEDMVAVTTAGADLLTPTAKDFIVI